MTTILRKTGYILALLPAFLIPLCEAAVTSVTAAPPTQNVAISASSMVRVTWSVTNAGGAATVISTLGTLRAGTVGPVIATVSSTLSRVVPAPGATIMFREAVSIPEQAVLRAQQLGFTQISYQRSFTDGGGVPIVGTATFNMTGSAGAKLSLSRIALRFPDNSRVKVMSSGATTHVLADLAFTGTGRLEAVWEIAEPSSTHGNPSFRTLRLIRRQLVGAGQQLTLRSPNLPARASGLYLVRFRVTSPPMSFSSPVIRYFVNPGIKPKITQALMQVVRPVSGARINSSTLFEWKPIPGARVYQVEFRALRAPLIADQIPSIGEDHVGVPPQGISHDDSYPAAGIMVGSSTQELSVSALTMSRLVPGSAYRWRVQAYDERGQLIGASEQRTITIPDDMLRPETLPVPYKQPEPELSPTP